MQASEICPICYDEINNNNNDILRFDTCNCNIWYHKACFSELEKRCLGCVICGKKKERILARYIYDNDMVVYARYYVHMMGLLFLITLGLFIYFIYKRNISISACLLVVLIVVNLYMIVIFTQYIIIYYAFCICILFICSGNIFVCISYIFIINFCFYYSFFH